MLSVLDDEDITVQLSGNKLIISDSTSIIRSSESSNKSQYPAQAIKGILENLSFPSKAILSKSEFQSIIERLNLFTKDGVISFIFTKDGLILSNSDDSGSEIIEYGEGSENFKPYNCKINSEYLKAQIGVVKNNIELHYGHESMVKIAEGNLTLLIGVIIK
jgi:hypothetical protein